MNKLLLATMLALAIGSAASASGANSPVNPKQQLASATSIQISEASSEATSAQDDLKAAEDLLNAALRDPSALGQANLAPVPPGLRARADSVRTSSQRVRANIAFVTPF